MLNKRIKSLLVAGLVILGMSGNVFAAEVPKGPFTSYQTYPTILDESSEAVFQGGAIVVDITELEESTESQDVYHYSLEWNNHKFKMNKLILFLDNGDKIEENLNSGSGIAQTKDVEGKQNFKLFKSQTAVAEDAKIVKIQVEYDYGTDTDEDGKPDFKDDKPTVPDTPNKPEKVDPETGDAGVAGLLLAAVGIGTGLVVVNKGKDDEEE